MSQSKRHSLLEVGLGTFVAMACALLTQLITFPLFKIPVTFGQNISLLLIFTTVSVIRSYLWRRFFNFLHVKGILK